MSRLIWTRQPQVVVPAPGALCSVIGAQQAPSFSGAAGQGRDASLQYTAITGITAGTVTWNRVKSAVNGDYTFLVLVDPSRSELDGNYVTHHGLNAAGGTLFSFVANSGTFAFSDVAGSTISGSSSSTQNRPYLFAGVHRAGKASVWKDGEFLAEAASSFPTSWMLDRLVDGRDGGASSIGGIRTYGRILFPRALTKSTLVAATQNFWQLFAPLPRRIWAPVSAGGATHTTTGALAAAAAAVAGTAAHLTLHTTSGALSAAAATVAGAAAHLTLHTTTGAMSADAAAIAGTAVHSAPGTHTTTGALSAGPSTVAGTATHLTLHATTGALSAQAAAIAGTAAHLTLHTTTGALVADAATIAGVALNGAAQPAADGDGSMSPHPGGMLHKYKLLQAFKDKQERDAAVAALPKATGPERVVLRKSARKLIESEPANYKEIEDRVGADLAAIGLMPAPNHLDWLLYFLRVEAHAKEQARLQALEAAESEEAAIALMLYMMET